MKLQSLAQTTCDPRYTAMQNVSYSLGAICILQLIALIVLAYFVFREVEAHSKKKSKVIYLLFSFQIIVNIFYYFVQGKIFQTCFNWGSHLPIWILITLDSMPDFFIISASITNLDIIVV